jgi:hypothetical protein
MLTITTSAVDLIPLAVMVALAIGGWVLPSRWMGPRPLSKDAERQLLLHGQKWLHQQFGDLDNSTAASTPSFDGPLQRGRILRQRTTVQTPTQRNSMPGYNILALETLLQDAKADYWFVIQHLQLDRKSGLIDLADPPYLERITELRARRALFNDPPAYQAAFGVAPSLAELNAWRKRHPEQEPDATPNDADARPRC